MASVDSTDGDDHVDDVIAKLDMATIKADDDLRRYSSHDDQEGEREGREDISIDGDTSAKKSSGSFINNLKRLMPTKATSQDSATTTGGANVDGADARGSSSNSAPTRDGQRGLKQTDRWKILKEVKVDKLPQGFVCKYVGSKPCTGLWGVRHTRQPVDQMVTELRKLGEGEDLPLVNIKVSTEGLKATLHVHNKSSRPLSDSGLLPLQFISYAVQDPRYTRIFVFILVREMSSRERKTECHAYLCSTDVFARKMALAMALTFREFGKKLEGKPHRFQVDLRNTDELETELSSNSSDGRNAGSEYEA